jgi:GTPase SAR1 family protein
MSQKLKIAIIGTHNSGKTTLCHKLVAELKEANYKVELVREAARYSYYLASGIRSYEMQLDILTRHVTEELDSFRTGEITICDRTVLDVLAYTHQLPKPISTKE